MRMMLKRVCMRCGEKVRKYFEVIRGLRKGDTGNSRNLKFLARKIHVNNSKFTFIFVNFKLY